MTTHAHGRVINGVEDPSINRMHDRINDAKAKIARTLKLFQQQPKSSHTFAQKYYSNEQVELINKEFTRLYPNGVDGIVRTIIRISKAEQDEFNKLMGIVPRQTVHFEKPDSSVPNARSGKRINRGGKTSRNPFKRAVLEQKGLCYFCGRHRGLVFTDEYGQPDILKLEEEHLLPKVVGGKEIHAACHVCNGVKSSYIFTGKDDPRLINLLTRQWSHYTVSENQSVCPTCKRAA